jgi:hypothetical protein
MNENDYLVRDIPLSRVNKIVVYGNMPYESVNGTHTTGMMAYWLPRAWPNFGEYEAGWDPADPPGIFVVEPPKMTRATIVGNITGTVITTGDITGGIHGGNVDLWKGLKIRFIFPQGRTVPISSHPRRG